MTSDQNRRILLVDDNTSIHEDFRKILMGDEGEKDSALSDARAAFFGSGPDQEETSATPSFTLTSAYQGQEGLEHIQKAMQQGAPFAMAFVDVRMPPGWDGVRTIKEIWAVDPNIEIVICTAYSDYSWSETLEVLGQSDKLLILKKPFDSVEIRQLANALTEKWSSGDRERALITELTAAEAQARSYAASLETVNQALRTAKASADKASELRGEFLDRVSCQVQSNLTTILERVAATGRTEGLEDVLEQSQRLLRTMNEILDFTQLKSGELVLTPRPENVTAIVQAVIDDFSEAAAAKGLDLRFQVQAGIPAQLNVDGGRVRQVMGMLVDNAVRYTSDGVVEVNMIVERGADWNSGTLRIEIADSGPGLTPTDAGQIFEPLTTGGSTGSGVGVALSKQLAKAMGGDLELSNVPGQGCTFSLLLDISAVAV